MTAGIMPAPCTQAAVVGDATGAVATMSPISESVSPPRPCEQAPASARGTCRRPRRALWTYSTPSALSMTGFVLGMQHTAVKPPWAAARVPDAMSSLRIDIRIVAGKVALDALLHGEVLADLDDLPVAHEDVGRFVQTDLRVDHLGVLKQQGHLRSPPSKRYISAMRSGCPRRLIENGPSASDGRPCSCPARRRG